MTEEQAEYNVVKKKANTKTESPEVKTCFVICPIGNEATETFRFANGLFEAAIVPVLEMAGKHLNIKFDSTVSHMIAEPGSITFQIVDRLLNSDLVIANLTTKNANVMYELAVRHAIAKPVVSIFEEGTHLPFDLKDDRAFSFKNDIPGVIALKDKLFEAVVNAMENPNLAKDNPIYRARSIKLLLDTSEKIEVKDLVKYIVDSPTLFTHRRQEQISQRALIFMLDDVDLPISIRSRVMSEIAECDRMAHSFFYPDRIEIRSNDIGLGQVLKILQKYQISVSSFSER